MAGARKKALAGTNGRSAPAASRAQSGARTAPALMRADGRGRARRIRAQKRVPPVESTVRSRQRGRMRGSRCHPGWSEVSQSKSLPDCSGVTGPRLGGRGDNFGLGPKFGPIGTDSALRRPGRRRRGRNGTRWRERYAGTEPQTFSGGMGNMTKHDTMQGSFHEPPRPARRPAKEHVKESEWTSFVWKRDENRQSPSPGSKTAVSRPIMTPHDIP